MLKFLIIFSYVATGLIYTIPMVFSMDDNGQYNAMIGWRDYPIQSTLIFIFGILFITAGVLYSQNKNFGRSMLFILPFAAAVTGFFHLHLLILVPSLFVYGPFLYQEYRNSKYT